MYRHLSDASHTSFFACIRLLYWAITSRKKLAEKEDRKIKKSQNTPGVQLLEREILGRDGIENVCLKGIENVCLKGIEKVCLKAEYTMNAKKYFVMFIYDLTKLCVIFSHYNFFFFLHGPK